MAILNQFGKPIDSGQYLPTQSREAGSYRGTIANWQPRKVANLNQAIAERHISQARAAELALNDWNAKSGLRAIADNAIGTGLVPKSNIPHEILGISKEEAAALGKKMEWAFSLWSAEASASARLQFEDLQYLGISSILRLGEMLHVPVMLKEKNRTFSLAIQALRPERLCTPGDLRQNLAIRDGVELTSYGKPVAYWIASPAPSLINLPPEQLSSASYTRRPAFIAHRQNVFHLFRHEHEEQVRGISQLSSGMKLFRHLNDALESELFAQVIAASFPLFIGLENGAIDLPESVRESYGMEAQGPNQRDIEVAPGTIIFGQPNEKPYILENKRPSANFPPFVEIIQRSLAAMLGIPYETLTKDYSRTNYSSMRAALNEAWKLYLFYRRWFGRLYCQPIYEMVIEEAYLRNFLGIGDAIRAGKNGFYAARQYWCSATWTGPAKGFIDPVKEIQATIMALDARLMTWSEAWAERGGDFDDALPIMQEEKAALRSLAPEMPARRQAAAQRSAAISPQIASDLECRAWKRDRKVCETEEEDV